MSAIQRYIEDAEAGGYNSDSLVGGAKFVAEHYGHGSASVLLGPAAWQAVGKTRGWESEKLQELKLSPNWRYNWHRFIDALADGKSIEEALTAID